MLNLVISEMQFKITDTTTQSLELQYSERQKISHLLGYGKKCNQRCW